MIACRVQICQFCDIASVISKAQMAPLYRLQFSKYAICVSLIYNSASLARRHFQSRFWQNSPFLTLYYGKMKLHWLKSGQKETMSIQFWT